MCWACIIYPISTSRQSRWCPQGYPSSHSWRCGLNKHPKLNLKESKSKSTTHSLPKTYTHFHDTRQCTLTVPHTLTSLPTINHLLPSTVYDDRGIRQFAMGGWKIPMSFRRSIFLPYCVVSSGRSQSIAPPLNCREGPPFRLWWHCHYLPLDLLPSVMVSWRSHFQMGTMVLKTHLKHLAVS